MLKSQPIANQPLRQTDFRNLRFWRAVHPGRAAQPTGERSRAREQAPRTAGHPGRGHSRSAIRALLCRRFVRCNTVQPSATPRRNTPATPPSTVAVGCTRLHWVAPGSAQIFFASTAATLVRSSVFIRKPHRNCAEKWCWFASFELSTLAGKDCLFRDAG